MPEPKRKRARKGTPKETPDGAPPASGQAGGAARFRPLYRQERFADGSVRAVRRVARPEREKGQALADFFGVPQGLAVDANVRSMDAILGELLEKLNVSGAEFAPEVLADAWLKAVGPFLATQAELLSIAKQRARIRTAHPAVRYELTRLKPQILRVLNETLGHGAVKTVQIIHG